MPHLHRPQATAARAVDSLRGCYWAETAPTLDTPVLSDDVETDFAVIGAGYTGLSAALSLARSGASVGVLDLLGPGWGASGRNGGFCFVGSSILSGEEINHRYGAAELQRFRHAERRSVELVQERIEELGLDVEISSQSRDIRIAHDQASLRNLKRQQPAIEAGYGLNCRLMSQSEMAAEGMRAEGVAGGLYIPFGFGLNPRKYALGLARGVLDAGGRIWGESPVLGISRENGSYVLRTPQGRLRARQVIIATNGYSTDNLPNWLRDRVKPVQAAIIVTRPLREEELAAQGWTSDILASICARDRNHFRLLCGNRLLFGSRGTAQRLSEKRETLIERTHQTMKATFPAWADVPITNAWTGLIAMSHEGVPFAGAIPGMENAYAAFAYHGNGVAMGSWCGDQLAKLARGEESTDVPDFMRQSRSGFPLSKLWQTLSAPLQRIRGTTPQG